MVVYNPPSRLEAARLDALIWNRPFNEREWLDMNEAQRKALTDGDKAQAKRNGEAYKKEQAAKNEK